MTLFVLGLLALGMAFLGTVGAAFGALLRLRLRLLADHSERGERISRYVDDPVRVIVPVRTGLLVLTAATAVTLAQMAAPEMTPRELATIGLLLALFTITFEQAVPALLARRNPERVFELLLPAFRAYVMLVSPIALPLVRLAQGARSEPGRGSRSEAGPATFSAESAGAPAEASGAAGEERGLLDGEEGRLLQSIVEFGDTLVREVMTPRPDIVAIRTQATIGELRALLREQQYSRVPVYDATIDHISGMVYVKDLIAYCDREDDGRSMTPLVRPAYFVPETKRVSELLREFQREQTQVAVVVDEYGGTAGLVTIEDVLEEIVGEIRDEYDVEADSVVDEGNGTYLVSGKAGLDTVSHLFHLPLDRTGIDTVGGFLLAHLGRVPAPGEVFELDGVRVEIVEAARRRINRIRVTRQAVPAPEASHEP